jgi:ABC-type phosphate/phosphonate transport system substrate-binding protein
MLRRGWMKTGHSSLDERPRSPRRRVASVCVGALLPLLLVSACMGLGDTPDNGKLPPMIMGMSARVLSGVDLKDAQAAMRLWIDQSRPTEANIAVLDVRIIADEAEMRKALEKKEVNYVIALALDYIRLRERGLVGKDDAAGVTGNNTDEYVLLVNREGPLKNLDGLKQKKIVVQVGGLGEVPTIWLDTLLMKQGLPVASQFCREVKPVPKASAAVLPVFFGQADACVATKKAFMTMSELNPQIGKRLSVLAQSASFPRAVSWFSKGWDRKSIEEYRTMMLKDNKAARTEQFLTLMGYESVTIWDPAILGPLEALLKEYDELSRKARESAAPDGEVKPVVSAPPATAPETSGRTDAELAKDK